MILLLITAAAGMFVGAGGVPELGPLAVLLAGGALASAGASALNHYLDRDIDALMGERTANRPIVAGRITAPRALEFGLVLSAFSFVLLGSLVNVLTAALALVGGLFYVIVYTRWLKRWTVQNIVIGGAAGAVPPLVGWAAATGNLTLPAISLFLIVFLWTPPHFWALALLIKRDYAAASVPMLPVVLGDRKTSHRILAYSLALATTTLLPFLWHAVGDVYLQLRWRSTRSSSASPWRSFARRPGGAPGASSTSRCSTSPSSLWRWRSTSCFSGWASKRLAAPGPGVSPGGAGPHGGMPCSTSFARLKRVWDGLSATRCGSRITTNSSVRRRAAAMALRAIADAIVIVFSSSGCLLAFLPMSCRYRNQASGKSLVRESRRLCELAALSRPSEEPREAWRDPGVPAGPVIAPRASRM